MFERTRKKPKPKTYKVKANFIEDYCSLLFFTNLVLKDSNIDQEVKERLIDEIGQEKFAKMFETWLWIGGSNGDL